MSGRRVRLAQAPVALSDLSDNAVVAWSNGAFRAIAGSPTIQDDGTLTFMYGYKAVNTTPYTVVDSDSIIGVDTSSTVVTLNLPAAAAANKGRVIMIKDEGADAEARAITIAASSGQTIDGASTTVINVARGSVSIYSNGAAWFII